MEPPNGSSDPHASPGVKLSPLLSSSPSAGISANTAEAGDKSHANHNGTHPGESLLLVSRPPR